MLSNSTINKYLFISLFFFLASFLFIYPISSRAQTQQTPYNGSPVQVPFETIQAEDFDNGGEGVAYHDTSSSNLGGASYRSGEGVDISSTPDTGGGYHVGYVEAGEWLEYTIDVVDTGTYIFEARVTHAQGGGDFHVEIDGQDITGLISVPQTGSWSTFETVERQVNLTRGTHIMRVYMDNPSSSSIDDVGDFNYFRFMASTSSSPTPGEGELIGDANGDLRVDGIDFTIWLNHYNTTTSNGATDGDFNEDTKVDGVDFTLWLNNYGTELASPTPTSTTDPINTPTPTTTTSDPTPTPTPPPTPTTPSGGELRAFPGAEGYGAFTPGGRGGRVIEVTNLNDSGTGSFRSCAEASGARTCVFRVAGTITINSDIEVTNPFLTIAGQTAPGDGITLKTDSSSSDAHLQIRTHDVIVRYIRSRPGTKVEGSRGLTTSNTLSGSDAVQDVIVDHMSMSWTGDEMYISWNNTNTITVQWSNISESLDPYKGPNLGDWGESGYLSWHHNLLAHHNQRYPLTRTSAGRPIDLVNNVMYNLGSYGYLNLRGDTQINIIGNYVIGGPTGSISTFVRESDLSSTGGYYRSGNIVESGWSLDRFASDGNRVSTRYNTPQVTTTSAEQAYEDVLSSAGAVHGLNCDGTWYSRPDSVDTRIISSVRNRTTSHGGSGFINDPSDVGGWPTLDPGTPCTDSDHDGMADEWEQDQFGTLSRGSASDTSSDFDGDGYTDLEEFLNGTDPTN